MLNSLYEVLDNGTKVIKSILTTHNDPKLFPDIRVKSTHFTLMKSNLRQKKTDPKSFKMKKRNMGSFKQIFAEWMLW